jgi:hypothetical protein
MSQAKITEIYKNLCYVQWTIFFIYIKRALIFLLSKTKVS